MTAKKPAMGREKTKKLKIKKETLKDLDAPDGKAKVIKGGQVHSQTGLVYCSDGGGC